ncbi:MAG: EAL domain-containing protein [Lysobacterales bacterium]
MSSDSQQSREAQLRKAFQKTLPRRIGGIQRRLKALAENGWDINTLHLIFFEVQQLAGSSGKYGLVEASENLSALEILLGGHQQGMDLPGADQNDEILRVIGELDQISGGADLEDLDTSRPTVVAKMFTSPTLPDPEIAPSGLPTTENIPCSVRPPAEFLPFDSQSVRPFHRLSFDQSSDLDADSIGVTDLELHRLAEANVELELGDIASQIITGDEQFEVEESEQGNSDWKLASKPKALSPKQQPEVAAEDNEPPLPPPEPAPATRNNRMLYFLHQDDKRSHSLAKSLGRTFEVNSFADVGEFREQLSAMGPDAVLIDGVFIDEVETLGPLVQKIRRKQDRPMPMLAFSQATDVVQRLKILRAGADAFLKSDASASEVLERLNELMRNPQDDPYRVLIVEDDRSQAMFAESILRKAGMSVRMERDPMQVLDHLEEFNPELILMDLYMPECDGMELTSIIRERDDFINTPIVFLSGESNTDKHFDALLAGGDDFLSKPIRPRHLIQAVTNRVQRARALARRQLTRAEPDTVTGLAERPALLERINDLLAESSTGNKDRPGGVLYVEIDDPFDLRQRLGLAGFEQAADQLGPLLSSELSSEDMATRYGDNAYCLLLPERRVDGLEETAKNCTARVASQLFRSGDGTINMTVSIGVCQLTSQFADAGALISAAERACNLGYSEGTSRVNVQELALDFSEESDDSVALTLESALDNDDLQVLFQPIVSLRGDSDEQYQALVRVNGDDGKPIAASRLIPAAEQNGLLGRIDRWMLQRAISVIDERQRLDRPIRLFVNQSAHSLGDREMLPRLYKQLQTRGLEPSYLVIEFKLPEIANRLKAAVECSKKLREIGVKVALGAFDGSNTAFQTLTHLAVDYVKLPATDEDGAVGKDLSAVVERLHTGKQLVIIPAIEDARTAAMLWQTGVDFIQGYFVQAPEAELAYQFNESQI